MLILWIVAIICLFLAVSHLIRDLFKYMTMRKLATLFTDDNARKSFNDLKPYLEQYINLAQKQTDTIMRNSVAYRQYIKNLESKNNK